MESSTWDVDVAIEKVGMGRGQWILFSLVALFLLADGVEVSYLSYVTRVLQVEWHLSAEQEARIISMVFWGEVLGAPVWGILADRVGRRPAFLWSALVISVAGFAAALCQSVLHLTLVRAAVGFGIAGQTAAFDIFAESLPSSHRGVLLMWTMFFPSLGSIYSTFVASLILEPCGWQAFTVACAVPTTLALLLSVWLLPESAHWLASQSRGEEAAQIVAVWARWNASPHEFASLTVPEELEDVDFASLARDGKLRRKFMLLSVVWLGFGAAFYGISFFVPHLFSEVTTDNTDATSVSKVTFDFGQILIARSSQIVGLVFGVLLIDRAGRKPVQIVGFLLAGVASFFLGFKSLGKTAIVMFTSLASASENAASTCTWVHTPELFPTQVRGLAHSLLNACARVGGAIAPYIVATPVPWSAFLIAGFSGAAGLAVCGLEETAGKSLDDYHDIDTDVDSDSDSNAELSE
ncbi:svop-1 [Symbiodinium natans]|uniref:Svop-1 protein n=1 Tax=Symbiodinium natans TaxID=878477 RepID=A0A812N411_9DINO|nr:svop-1 [Symbiodinium natans]